MVEFSTSSLQQKALFITTEFTVAVKVGWKASFSQAFYVMVMSRKSGSRFLMFSYAICALRHRSFAACHIDFLWADKNVTLC